MPKKMPTLYPIAYPLARDPNQQLVAAEHASHHPPYTCIRCGKRMFLRGGTLPTRPHFYHAHPTENHSAESWLHARNDYPLFTIEVVVTHSPDEVPQRQYAAMRLPVFIVRPRFDTVTQLLSGLTEHLTEVWHLPCRSPHHPPLYPTPRRCPRCRTFLRQVKLKVGFPFPCPCCGKALRVLRAFELHHHTLQRFPKRFWTRRFINEIAFGLGVRLAGWNGRQRSPTTASPCLTINLGERLRGLWASRAHQCPYCANRLHDRQMFSLHARARWQPVKYPERIAFYVACLHCDSGSPRAVYPFEEA